MTNELFTSDGKRKYLNTTELAAFIKAAAQQDRAEIRTFWLVMAHTGCRISEVLALTPARIDLAEQATTFRTLKQRDTLRYRAVPVPASTLDALELVHRLKKAQKSRQQAEQPLWPWGRTQGWKHLKAAMEQAGIHGSHATPKGLRHGFGVRAAEKTRNPRLVQKWLGHRQLETTTIYMDVVGQEERQAAQSMW